jgi:molybdopterin-guanine dinucleotide biosynthesis protein A
MLKNKRNIWGLVLSGGMSKRMGQDKALIEIDGNTQLNKTYTLLQNHLPEVFVSSRADQSADNERKKYNQIYDLYNNIGPLAGIVSAMQEHPEVDWLVVACDLMNLDDKTIDYLIENYHPNDKIIAYKSEYNGLPEPLCAIYSASAKSLLDESMNRKIICPRKILINSNAKLLTQPNPSALENFNTPEDLHLQKRELGHG